MIGEPPQWQDNRGILPLFDVTTGGVLDRLLLALAGNAGALGGSLRAVLLRDPADPVRPPASLGLGGRGGEVVEARGGVVAGPILIFTRRGRVDHSGDMPRSREPEGLGTGDRKSTRL